MDAGREQISDAVAVYFLMPTAANVARICQDCRAQLYDKYYLNFVTAIPRPLLEEVAKASLEADCVPQIGKVCRQCCGTPLHFDFQTQFVEERVSSLSLSPSQVYDQYLNFISLEDDFFVLRNQMLGEVSYYGENTSCGKQF